MNRTVRIGLLIVVFAAQLAVPGWMLGQREWVLRTGTIYKFKTAPVDPYDAFRGRYVALGFEESQAEWGDAGMPPTSGTAYVTVSTGEDGFAHLGRVTREPPANGDYFRVEVWRGWIPDSTEERKVQLQLPFDRYYMNERKAPLAEQAYREHSRVGSQDAYVTVRVRSGTAVIEQLYVADQPIEAYVDTMPEGQL